MRAFPVPIQMHEEERIMGGMISLRQTAYIALGLALGGASFYLGFLPLIIRLLLFLIVSGVGLFFAFAKFDDLRVDQYIFYYLKWRFGPRKMYIRGEN